MKTIKFVILAIAAVLMVSCGTNKYPFVNAPIETRVNLSQNNYRIVKMVTGQASAKYVFGIGGLSKKALTGNAIADMYKNANLTGNQQIIDITTSYSKRIILIYSDHICTAQGYVIEFLDEPAK